MSRVIYGSSSVTERQLIRYCEENCKPPSDDELLQFNINEIISLYVKYAAKYNIAVDIAMGTVLIYTDFFKNTVDDFNLCGIGVTNPDGRLERFRDLEEFIIAHCEILQKISSDIEIENPLSMCYTHMKNLSAKTSTDVYFLFKYNELSSYNIYEFDIFLREIERTREQKVVYGTAEGLYYYILVKSSPSKKEIIKLRSELKNKGFDMNDLHVYAKNGNYRLEYGQYQSPVYTQTLLDNLMLYGYTGTIGFRKVGDE